MSEVVRIHEVGPRDGLQAEKRIVPVAERVALIDKLSASGVWAIEVGSFVNPARVPQMAGTDQVMAMLTPKAGMVYSVLVPNLRGLEGFIAARASNTGLDWEIALFIAASEGFSRANIGCSIAESLTRVSAVVEAARPLGVRLRGYISCLTDCPYDGPVDPAAVARVAKALYDIAPMPISLGDTLGRGTPERVTKAIAAVAQNVPLSQLAGHFHDTGGKAADNIEAALALGLRDFDAAVGGLGGCPFAPGAPGNVATELAVARIEALGYATGVNRAILAGAAQMARDMRAAQ